MGLVDYSDSDEEELPVTPPAKKRKGPDSSKKDEPSTSTSNNTLPPLPAAFRDLYSSTVRTSTQDDPSLHAGRKRVTPHVAGSWPSHVYLEWCPQQDEHALLTDVVDTVRRSFPADNEVHSLLANSLGVQLPLHVSLSRPLALKTEQKDAFAARLGAAIVKGGSRALNVTPLDLIWHANEDRTRWFLVVRLQRPPSDELRKLLKLSNDLASDFSQPLLYHEVNRPASDTNKPSKEVEIRPHDSFHISIAWSLHPRGAEKYKDAGSLQQAVSNNLRDKLSQLSINFSEVKLRVGQDVTSMPLQKRRMEQQNQ